MCRVPLNQESCKYQGSLGLIPRTFWKYDCLYSIQNSFIPYDFYGGACCEVWKILPYDLVWIWKRGIACGATYKISQLVHYHRLLQALHYLRLFDIMLWRKIEIDKEADIEQWQLSAMWAAWFSASSPPPPCPRSSPPASWGSWEPGKI